MFSLAQFTLVVLVALCVALFALFLMARHRDEARKGEKVDYTDELAFLYEDGRLIDATPSAWRLVEFLGAEKEDFLYLIRFLTPRFPDLAKNVALLNSKEINEFYLTSRAGNTVLFVEQAGTRLRLTFDPVTDRVQVGDDPGYHAMFRETERLSVIADAIPYPLWIETPRGRVIWTNAEYRRCQKMLGLGVTAELLPRRMFPKKSKAEAKTGGRQRAQIDFPGEAGTRWFEFTSAPVGRDELVVAAPVDRVVQAEKSLNGFVQTLTQTFAHLNVGLAIFSRARELAIFNPALADILELAPEFLVTHPPLAKFFDHLRDRRMVPEPKNNEAWRRKIAALEAAATDSAFSETWSLVDGRTFRVTGRPHAEGAVAFIFEDISAEISLERKFRARLQMQLAVINGLDEAIAVFNPSGSLSMANRAYQALWFDTAEAAEPDTNFVDASRHWQAKSVPTPVWEEARYFAATIGERKNWTADIRLRAGGGLRCRFETLQGGFTLAGFSRLEAGQTAPRPTDPRQMTA